MKDTIDTFGAALRLAARKAHATGDAHYVVQLTTRRGFEVQLTSGHASTPKRTTWARAEAAYLVLEEDTADRAVVVRPNPFAIDDVIRVADRMRSFVGALRDVAAKMPDGSAAREDLLSAMAAVDAADDALSRVVTGDYGSVRASIVVDDPAAS